MRFEERVFVARPVEHVWAFVEDLSNLPRWDRGVARVEVTSWTGGVGTTFDTFAKNDRGRMSQEVTEAEPNRRHTAVTRSGFLGSPNGSSTLKRRITGPASPASRTSRCASVISCRRQPLRSCRSRWPACAVRERSRDLRLADHAGAAKPDVEA